MEKIPRVYKVCGCMDLRAGNKAVAYVIIAINFFAILGTWVVIWQDEDDISKSLTELSKAIPELKPTDDDLKDAVGKNENLQEFFLNSIFSRPRFSLL